MSQTASKLLLLEENRIRCVKVRKKIKMESHICDRWMLSVSGEICVNVDGFGKTEVY